MVTVYGAKSSAEAMIANVRSIHDSIEGRTDAGEFYRANDPELLDWVQATASYGFLEAYCAYVRPLPPAARDLFYAEGVPAASLYGATGAPRDEHELAALFAKMRPKLERSEVIFEFLRIMRHAPLLPTPLRPVQRLLVRAAVDVVPPWARRMTGLEQGLNGWSGKRSGGSARLPTGYASTIARPRKLPPSRPPQRLPLEGRRRFAEHPLLLSVVARREISSTFLCRIGRPQSPPHLRGRGRRFFPAGVDLCRRALHAGQRRAPGGRSCLIRAAHDASGPWMTGDRPWT
jgi:hypothetical protein